MNYKFVYIIPTFDRFDLVKQLIDQILSFDSTYQNRKIILLNDGTNDIKYNIFKNYNDKIDYIKHPQNLGKHGYWKTVNQLFSKLKNYNYDYAVMIPDDIKILPNFELEINKMYKETDYDIIRLFQQTGTKINWGTKDWIDGAFVAKSSYFKKFNYGISQPHRTRNSSGVGRVMSLFNEKNGCGVFYKYPLIQHLGNNDSKMNPIERARTPLNDRTSNRSDLIFGVITDLCDINNVNDIIKIKEVLTNQIDKLLIYTKNTKFDYLNSENVEVVISNEIPDIESLYKTNKNVNLMLFNTGDIYGLNYVHGVMNQIKLNHGLIITKNGMSEMGWLLNKPIDTILGFHTHPLNIEYHTIALDATEVLRQKKIRALVLHKKSDGSLKQDYEKLIRVNRGKNISPSLVRRGKKNKKNHTERINKIFIKDRPRSR